MVEVRWYGMGCIQAQHPADNFSIIVVPFTQDITAIISHHRIVGLSQGTWKMAKCSNRLTKC